MFYSDSTSIVVQSNDYLTYYRSQQHQLDVRHHALLLRHCVAVQNVHLQLFYF
jgi:hypothetical protein